MNKQMRFFVIVLGIMLTFCGCGDAQKANETTSNFNQEKVNELNELNNNDNVKESINDISFSIPSEWQKKENNGKYYYYTPNSDFLYYTFQDDNENEFDDTYFDNFIDGVKDSVDGFVLISKGQQQINNRNYYNFRFSDTINNTPHTSEVYILPIKNKFHQFLMMSSGTEFKYSNKLVEILSSIEINENNERVIDAPQKTTGVSLGQKNALAQAKNYLQVSAFSKTGLIEQLEYEGFTYEEATYGAENSGADWYEQAAKSAKNYLDVSSFSKNELIQQLEYEGFTQDEALFGVKAVGY